MTTETRSLALDAAVAAADLAIRRGTVPVARESSRSEGIRVFFECIRYLKPTPARATPSAKANQANTCCWAVAHPSWDAGAGEQDGWASYERHAR